MPGKSVVVLSTVFLALACVSGCRTSEPVERMAVAPWPCVMEVAYTPNAIRVDGVMDEASWQDAQAVFFMDDIDSPNRNTARAWVLWDKTNLYVAFSVKDSYLRATHTEHDTAFPGDDGVEILIDTRLDRSNKWLPDDYCWHVNLNGAILDDRGTSDGKIDHSWNGNALSKTVIDGTLNDDEPDKGYVTEIAIPWSDLGLGEVDAGIEIGLDLCVNDFDENPEIYQYSDWCNLKVFHQPSGFGLARMVRQIEIPARKPSNERVIW
ncbi:MAG TPA: sugar-binding protein [bacterium]|nr:sugar-binding protein [bacterium]